MEDKKLLEIKMSNLERENERLYELVEEAESARSYSKAQDFLAEIKSNDNKIMQLSTRKRNIKEETN